LLELPLYIIFRPHSRSWWTFPLNREHLIALSIFKKDESAKEIIASSEQFLHARFGQTVSASEPAVENVSEALKERQLLRIESIPSKGRVGRGVIMGTGFWFLSHIIDSMENRISASDIFWLFLVGSLMSVLVHVGKIEADNGTLSVFEHGTQPQLIIIRKITRSRDRTVMGLCISGG
jgi:hypothetical protein